MDASQVIVVVTVAAADAASLHLEALDRQTTNDECYSNQSSHWLYYTAAILRGGSKTIDIKTCHVKSVNDNNNYVTQSSTIYGYFMSKLSK